MFRLRHVPGLDGVRGLAVAAVLVYHQGFRWARGGYLGVSTFFTLSGFLIASLLLADVAGDGRVRFAHFWERRARRLLPAAFVTIAGIVILQSTEHLWSGSWLRGDLLAALGYSANWRFALSDRSYGVLFGQQSPVLHFWSLGIEEQFYLVFPLLFAALVTWCRSRWARASIALAALACASFDVAAVTAHSAGNGGFAYYGTQCRVGELLVGTVLAFVVLMPRFRRWVDTRGGRLVVQTSGVVAVEHTWPDCDTFVADSTAEAERLRPQVMFVVMGLGDLGDHRFDSGPLADGRWHHLGQVEFDQWELAQLRRAAVAFSGVGVPVVLATFPEVRVKPYPDGDGSAAENDPARVRRFNELLREATAGRPNLQVIDFASWVKRWPAGEFAPTLRTDGVHLSQPNGSDVAVRFLAPYLLRDAARSPH